MQVENVLIQGEPLATLLHAPKDAHTDLLFVHGFTGSKEDLAPVAAILAQSGFRVLTFDHRGNYQSGHTKRADGYSMESLGRDVVELSKYFGLKKPHLLGHSFGGLISQQAIRLSPSNWSSVTLMCSGPGGRLHWLDEPQFNQYSNETKETIWQEIMAPARLGNPKFDLWKERWLATDANATLTYRDHLLKQPSLISDIARFKIPAHVIYGENDDAWPIDVQNQMAKDLGAMVTVLPQLGHCPNEENPEVTAEALASFWRGLTH